MYNKTIIEFGFCMISWIIKTSCLYYLPQPSASADNTDLGFDNSWYHAQPHPIIVYYFSAVSHVIILNQFPAANFNSSHGLLSFFVDFLFENLLSMSFHNKVFNFTSLRIQFILSQLLALSLATARRKEREEVNKLLQATYNRSGY